MWSPLVDCKRGLTRLSALFFALIYEVSTGVKNVHQSVLYHSERMSSVVTFQMPPTSAYCILMEMSHGCFRPSTNRGRKGATVHLHNRHRGLNGCNSWLTPTQQGKVWILRWYFRIQLLDKFKRRILKFKDKISRSFRVASYPDSLPVKRRAEYKSSLGAIVKELKIWFARF